MKLSREQFSTNKGVLAGGVSGNPAFMIALSLAPLGIDSPTQQYVFGLNDAS